MTSITINFRFRGPPDSGNGGYVSGRIAEYIDGAAEVTLRLPTPLDKTLEIAPHEDGIALRDGETLIATGRAIDLDMPNIPTATFREAEAAHGRSPFTADNHVLPECFVCGPGRAHGDGLRISAGLLESAEGALKVYAAPWRPGAGLAAADGRIASEFIWSALDCPTAYTLTPVLQQSEPPAMILLGRMAVRIDARPMPGEKCVIMAWMVAAEGRKLLAEAALLNAGGEPIAVARNTWIKLKTPQS